MANFDVCFNWMMDNEDRRRSYQTVPDYPPGSSAISGINSHAYPNQFASILAIPQNQRGPAVQEFYQVNFWNQWFGQLSYDDVAKRVFDAAVNMGPATAVKLLQIAVGFNTSDVDGAWGPHTVSAANVMSSPALVNAFQSARTEHYRQIVDRNPSEGIYLPAWIARAEK